MKRRAAVWCLLMSLLCLTGCDLLAPIGGSEAETWFYYEEEIVREAEIEPQSDADGTVSSKTGASSVRTDQKGSSAGSTASLKTGSVTDPKLPTFSPSLQEYFYIAIGQSDFYQYGFLPANEKKAYRLLVQAAQKGAVTVRVGDCKCTSETIFRVYRAFMADCPQFFYLSKTFLYTVGTWSDRVNTVILHYTDGSVTDEYNTKGRIIRTADRSRISEQIEEFSKKTEEWIAGFSTDWDVWGIEKQLHDKVIDEVAYDTETAEKVAASVNVSGHAFDAYGAACEGKAVCEGYAKLFQFLCYRMGINCTTVIGTVEEGSHMWNAAQLEGEWTMLDLTWDDAETEGLRYYRYFNLTESEMSADHIADREGLAVPSCTSEEGAFYRRFAFDVRSLSAPPEHFEEALDRLAAGNDRYLCIKMNGNEQRINRYIQTYLFPARSEVQRYIREQGYNIRFDTHSYISGDYLYLHLI